MHSTYVLQKYVKHSWKESITNNPSDEENGPQSETNALPPIFPQNFRNLPPKGSSQKIRFVRHSELEFLKITTLLKMKWIIYLVNNDRFRLVICRTRLRRETVLSISKTNSLLLLSESVGNICIFN
ncbi:hypothetical protein TNIN_246901 [Trichonephila inaurata madagascariensis]|uniref:Uncharacterized protein n=1 Tax=Trichonephila inaurata madagascariensis TaxID=2747483 RepID=A0A8X6XKV0_9ARAC|nr:hypothetical protein TNIN_246901 [Trichonephila inaurata madagascariensis]